MNHKIIFSVTVFYLLSSFYSNYIEAQKISREEYIETYKDWAIQDMKKSGIPASIKLAQGILESSCGNSDLAKKSNNHFGIKCHNDWTGKKVYHDDDSKNECFRVYKDPLQSFEDHSTFLTTRSRYQKLFDFDPTDYKSWAKGLKECGYATNPQYPNMLIKIIEENELYLYDREGGEELRKNPQKHKPITENAPVVNPFSTREIKYNNGVKYIEVKKGDTFSSISKEFKLREWELPHYNDLSQGADISSMQIIYIQPKRNNAHPSHKKHTVKSGETMHSISHQYGMKLKKLYKFNNIPQGKEPKAGDTINLRKNKNK